MLPMAMSSNVIDMLEGTLVFILILDFDNLINLDLSEEFIDVKFEKQFKNLEIFNVI